MRRHLLPFASRYRRRVGYENYHIVKTLIDDFEMYHIPRESNTRADLLSKVASTKKVGHLKTIIQVTLQALTIDTKEVMAGEKEEPDWMTSYKNF